VSASAQEDLVSSIVEAMSTFDPAIGWYFDAERRLAVRIEGGVCSDRLLTQEAVDDDAERFLEIPALLRIEEHEWMTDFVDQHENPRLGRMLDDRKGANARFLDRLQQHHQAVIAEWETYRAERLRLHAAEWIEAGSPR